LDWSWGVHNHKGMDKIVFETLHELVFHMPTIVTNKMLTNCHEQG
jgi:hypothetical protein